MIDKKIIKEISVETGISEKKAENVIKAILKKNFILSKDRSDDLTEKKYNQFIKVFKTANEIFDKLLRGTSPDSALLPEDITENAVSSFTESLNNFLAYYHDLTDFVDSLATGDLDHVPPKGEMILLSSLKTLHTHLRDLTNKTKLIAAGDFSQHVDFFGDFSTAFNSMTSQLRDSFEKIEFHKLELEKANEDLIMAQTVEARDMDMAVTVQRSLMPDSSPVSSSWEIAYFFKPMAGVSGDFYDFYLANDELSGISLFDVSGHGISSALISMIAKWIIYQAFHKNLNKNLNLVPLKISRDLNAAIGKSDYYLTGVILKFEGDTVKYINASHPDVLIKKGKSVFPLRKPTGEQPAGMLLGMNIATSVYDEISYKMKSGEYILLYTDGLSECCKTSGKEFGVGRLKKALRESPGGGSAQETLNFLIDKVSQFTGRNSFDDDCTVIVVKKI